MLALLFSRPSLRRPPSSPGPLSSPLVGLAGADLSRALHLSALHLSLRTCFSFFRFLPASPAAQRLRKPTTQQLLPRLFFFFQLRSGQRVTADEVPARTSQPSPSSPPPALCSSFVCGSCLCIYQINVQPTSQPMKRGTTPVCRASSLSSLFSLCFALARGLCALGDP